MTRIFKIVPAFLICVLAFPAIAQDFDLKSCPALRDEKAYGKKYDENMYLVQGKDNWVFRTSKDFRMEYKVDKKAIRVLKDFQALLKSRGIELVIAFAPTRAMTVPESLPQDEPLLSKYDSKLALQNYAGYIAAMNAAGVHMVGTEKIADGQNYFNKADHHWRTGGAREMAKAIAAKVKSLPVYESIKKIPYTMEAVGPDKFEGRFNRTLKDMCGFTTPDEEDTKYKSVVQGGSSDESALFGEQPAPEIVLLGTSNSKRGNNDVNFDGFLKQELSADVLNAAISGGGIDDSFYAYFTSKDFREHPPKVIIWEVPGYYDLTRKTFMNIFSQTQPAIFGECGSSAMLTQPETKISGEQVEIFTGIKSKNIKPQDAYFLLKFNEPVEKSFKVDIVKADSQRERFKFTRSDNYPYDGIYYYGPQVPGTATLQSIVMRFPDSMKGVKFQAWLCPYGNAPISSVESDAPRTWKRWFSGFFN